MFGVDEFGPFEWHSSNHKHELIEVEAFCGNCLKERFTAPDNNLIVRGLIRTLQALSDSELASLGFKRYTNLE